MPSSKGTVFIIDDDEVVRDSLQALLEARNYAVADFTSGRDFLHRGEGERADCVLIDVHMSEMNGLDVMKALRERGDRTPVVLITGRTDAGIQAQAKTLSASALLDKPISAARLFDALEEAIASAKA